jgi:hypothetical protein
MWLRINFLSCFFDQLFQRFFWNFDVNWNFNFRKVVYMRVVNLSAATSVWETSSCLRTFSEKEVCAPVSLVALFVARFQVVVSMNLFSVVRWNLGPVSASTFPDMLWH